MAWGSGALRIFSPAPRKGLTLVALPKTRVRLTLRVPRALWRDLRRFALQLDIPATTLAYHGRSKGFAQPERFKVEKGSAGSGARSPDVQSNPARIEPAREVRRLPRREAVEQIGRGVGEEQQRGVLGTHEALLDGVA